MDPSKVEGRPWLAGCADDERDDGREDRCGERDRTDDEGAPAAEPLAEFLAEHRSEAEEQPAPGGRPGGAGPEGQGLGGHAATSFWSISFRKTVSRSSVSSELLMRVRPAATAKPVMERCDVGGSPGEGRDVVAS